MKKDNITLKMESQKLSATKRYMEKKDVSIEQELGEALQKLYEKHVPAAVREYIDETTDSMPASKAKKQKEKNNAAAPNQSQGTI
ncbi:DUF6103 family protein [Ruminiclostridium cellobioparum]|jgi:hypothetical protein|uniref:DUF6103 family protein n=1 Tax=Ruminiclostridium cellobioparum TaxID=29355 RepID=UPI0028A7CBBB|nr:DUF6103 family protein [Ruminiclostridium cellobioparum]